MTAYDATESYYVTKQSPRMSLVEVLTNIAVGFAIALILNATLFSHPPSLGENLWVAGVFTVASLARAYVLRRVFNRWHQ